MSQVSLLYTTFASTEDALQITRNLLEMQLIACANILSEIQSLYLWRGRVEDNREIAVILKSTSEKVPELMKVLQELHSYETPAILEIPLHRVNESFAKWVQESMR